MSNHRVKDPPDRPNFPAGQAAQRWSDRPLDMACAKNVEHRLAGAIKVIRDDAPMAPPPHGFCAHDGAAPRASEVPQCRQPAAKAFAHRVVRVVVEALVFARRRWHPAAHRALRPRRPPTIKCARTDFESSELPENTRLYCGIARERGTVRTSATSVTPAPRSTSTKSPIGQVEWRCVERLRHASHVLTAVRS